ncbi:hypothetical protein N177_1643 [Lutibaculum baratangense AMV1]|uniref:Uncharacterized protein n=1 Tax=Lutibaculum baratangense AMV1 TaxID=631454 RepID=V4RHD4_9HYPH|nr:hypothetical protein N177_1643 [Lutibaculum baratangense AMV1]
MGVEDIHGSKRGETAGFPPARCGHECSGSDLHGRRGR